ncbi:type II toxin-antitoxin system death-on-curing family toxin [Candidatus Kaiserbacteria bacterium]|nr:type II toxin-antitoxin system death-on-curing family toxin [Candidatus Kaiserbacteria bacterium]
MTASRKNKIEYISAAEVLAIHDRIIDGVGGIRGVRDENLFRSAAMRPQTAFGGSDVYPDVWTKAAVLMEGIAVFHPFSDGNKRTSITAASAFLYRNGYEIELPVEETEEMVLDVAQKKMDVPQIAAWLQKHSRGH